MWEFTFLNNEETEPTPSRGYSKESELAKTISSVSDSRVSQNKSDVKHQISDRQLTKEQQAELEAKAQKKELARLSRQNEIKKGT